MGLPKKIRELIPYYSYNIHFSDEDEAYVVTVDELTGCMTHGDSAAEALEMAHEAVEGHLEVLLSQKQDIPEPIAKIKAGKKIKNLGGFGSSFESNPAPAIKVRIAPIRATTWRCLISFFPILQLPGRYCVLLASVAIKPLLAPLHHSRAHVHHHRCERSN